VAVSGLGNEVERQAHKRHWNYWQFYADAGYFVSSRTEPRTWSFAVESHCRTTNLLINATRGFRVPSAEPGPARTSISEAAGVSFKYLSGRHALRAPWPTFRCALQYRAD